MTRSQLDDVGGKGAVSFKFRSPRLLRACGDHFMPYTRDQRMLGGGVSEIEVE